MSDLRLERKDDVLAITLNRPDKLNALSESMKQGLIDTLTAEARSPSARAVLIRANGRGFCVGADLQPDRIMARRETIGQELEAGVNVIVSLLRQLPVPVIAAVNGAAAGAGFSLALAADMVVAAESATFRLAFSRIGAVLDGGASHFLTRRLGTSRAMALAMLGESLSAAEAHDLGLVYRITADDELARTAGELAQTLARGPSVALGLIKQQLNTAEAHSLEDSLAFEAVCQGKAFLTQDFEEGVSAFLAKRPPRFAGK
ncbi:enoyl-CoA hydratase-related protein [Marinobacter sp. SS21]|uniref:enoyl-CoA hydratase-related protein n=1 Tax=Marinobacter sp. SS21 TaxID=2979460 RepID=UPI00232BB2AD|nr:enoyl-CoA hydratase-related protein [Marinobacter sp. SS21]MDC0662971.1 enoyl-CoA hydratase-related protein [Marinobacter sp. SS21]